MKKTILAAAVALTIGTGAMASVDLSGKYEGKLKDNGDYSQKVDLKLTAKSGATTLITTFDIDTGAATGITVGESYIKTTIAGVSVKAGQRKGQSGNGLTYKKSSAASKLTIGGKFSGFGVAATQKTGSPSVKIDVSGGISGVKVKIQDVTRDSRMISLSVSMSGVSFALENSDKTTAFSLGTSIGGINAKYVSIGLKGAETATQNDGIFGDISGASDASGLVVSTATGMGKVTGKHYEVLSGTTTKTTTKVSLSSGPITYTYATWDDGTTSDDSISAKIKFKF